MKKKTITQSRSALWVKCERVTLSQQNNPEQYQPHLSSASLSKQLLQWFFSTKTNYSNLNLPAPRSKPETCRPQPPLCPLEPKSWLRLNATPKKKPRIILTFPLSSFFTINYFAGPSSTKSCFEKGEEASESRDSNSLMGLFCNGLHETF